MSTDRDGHLRRQRYSPIHLKSNFCYGSETGLTAFPLALGTNPGGAASAPRIKRWW